MANTVLEFPEQKVFAGTESLEAFAKHLTKTLSPQARPLIVSDKGLVKVGVVDNVVSVLKKQGFSPVVFDDSHPNPSVEDVKAIATSYFDSNCDSCIGVGGGGPLDAVKGAVAVIARKKSESTFSIENDAIPFLTTELKPFLQKIPPNFSSAVPFLGAIPTTAGTGSEGGKSAVITDPQGTKFVFGNPIFFPKLVALVPQFTQHMPRQLTSSTGIDALFHLLEAYFVTEQAAIADGLDANGIARCDNFAVDGVNLVVKYLPRAYENGTDMEARFYMQIAALYGAKAFRKGDLGGIHATAHAVGAYYHLHHGSSIARMSVPVLKFNSKQKEPNLHKKFEKIRKIFNTHGISGDSIDAVVLKFLKQFGLDMGLAGLKVTEKEIEILAKMAKNDGCQTNPIPLTEADYKVIFMDAWQMS